MLSEHGRRPVTVVAKPIARSLVKLGVTADMVTVTGLVATVAAALLCYPQGNFVVGSILIAVFTLFDLLDGAVARASGGGSPYGAVVDAVSDRIADGAIFAALVWWVIYNESENHLAAVALLTTLVLSQVVSYTKARADAGGLDSPNGLMERADRLVVVLVSVGLEGLGAPWALEIGAVILAVGSAITILQRMRGIRHSYLLKLTSAAADHADGHHSDSSTRNVGTAGPEGGTGL